MASSSKTSTDVPSIAAEAVLAKSDFDSTNATVKIDSHFLCI